MAKKNIQNAQAIEETAAIAPVEEIAAVEEVAAPAGPTTFVVFHASRGKGQRLTWDAVEVAPDAALTKIKGCAAEIPEAIAALVGTDKFIAHVDAAIIARCVEEGKAIRGTASTVTDVYNRYAKVTGETGDRIEIALAVFAGIIEAIKAGTMTGEWVRPEPEAPEAGEGAPAAEGGAEEEPAA